MPRERVVELAEKAHAAGARVLVHEAEPILAGGPWRAVELRRLIGENQRTWAPTGEWATISFEPATDYARRSKDRRQASLPLRAEAAA